MCLRQLALVLSLATLLASVPAEAKKGGVPANGLGKGNGNGNNINAAPGSGGGNWNGAVNGSGSIRSTGQHAINAVSPNGQARAAAQHTLNDATKATRRAKFPLKLFRFKPKKAKLQ